MSRGPRSWGVRGASPLGSQGSQGQRKGGLGWAAPSESASWEREPGSASLGLSFLPVNEAAAPEAPSALPGSSRVTFIEHLLCAGTMPTLSYSFSPSCALSACGITASLSQVGRGWARLPAGGGRDPAPWAERLAWAPSLPLPPFHLLLFHFSNPSDVEKGTQGAQVTHRCPPGSFVGCWLNVNNAVTLLRPDV